LCFCLAEWSEHQPVCHYYIKKQQPPVEAAQQNAVKTKIKQVEPARKIGRAEKLVRKSAGEISQENRLGKSAS
jgi:hypothetical protein